MNRTLVLSGLSCWLASAASPVLACPLLVDLGNLGSDNTVVSDAAAAHVVGGSNTVGGVSHAFDWFAGSMSDLGTLGGATSVAKGINSSQSIVGFSLNGSGQTRGFIWSAGTMTALGTLGGATSVALSINSSGVVVGHATTGGWSPQTHGVRWNGVGITDLGTLGGNYSIARRVNGLGNIVGAAKNAAGVLLPAYYPTVPPFGWIAMTLPAGFTSGEAYHISENGVPTNRWQVGYGVNASGVAKAIRWTSLTTPVVLPDLFGASYASYALAISPNGQKIVGVAYNSSGQARAFRWSNTGGAGTIEDLNQGLVANPSCVGWTLTDAVAVTDAGQVWGNAKYYFANRGYQR